ncbi:MAG: biotin--[acetyl-CoA-carboxylase] ligase [Pyrinomonadaceae bacterium]|nr:biotin--[acetyl-CoA-carboxylase] ligase [Pyrinomonadaceae bacterium]
MTLLTPQILRFESLPSTNLEAARRAIEGAPEGLCVVASEQTAGRGRLEREWLSPEGAGLYFTIVLRPDIDQSAWPLLTLMAAVAVSEALLDSCALQTDIKWPNDVLANDKKLCGILAETVETSIGRAVVVGIGINLTNHAFQNELNKVATSVEAVTGQRPDLEGLLEALVGAIAKYYQMLQTPDGREVIIREWSRRSTYASGKRIRVANGDEILEGISRGLERDGALRVETADGDIRIVRTGDVSRVRPASN